jgi:predicted dehydrogenase
MRRTTVTTRKKVAVVGCGYWGKNLVRNFAVLDSLAMVCDSSPEGRRLARQLAPEADVVSSFGEVLESPIDAVVIATPPETHYTLARRALAAGKDTFVEKPLAMTYEQGVEIVRVAKEHDQVLMVGHVLEYHPAVVRLLELVRDGELGSLQYVYSDRLSLGIVRREENILWSFAPHDIAVILRLMGNMPIQVAAHGGNYIQPDIADVTVTNLLFRNGVRAHIHVSWLHPFKEQRLVAIGSRKMASFDDVAKRLVLYDQRVEVKGNLSVPVRGSGEEVSFAADEPLRLECQAFLEAMETRERPLTDGYSALRVLGVLEAAQRSLETDGEPVKLPLGTAAKILA